MTAPPTSGRGYAMTARLHSTERAALRFALGRLRQSFPRCRERTPAATWLYSPHAVDHAMRAAMIAIAASDPELHRAAAEAASHVSVNAWIVRVCLYLRAVLRAEAGDVGRWWVGEMVGPDGAPVRLHTGYVRMGINRGEEFETRLAQVRGRTRAEVDRAWDRSHGVVTPDFTRDWPVRTVIRRARPLWADAPPWGGP